VQRRLWAECNDLGRPGANSCRTFRALHKNPPPFDKVWVGLVPIGQLISSRFQLTASAPTTSPHHSNCHQKLHSETFNPPWVAEATVELRSPPHPTNQKKLGYPEFITFQIYIIIHDPHTNNFGLFNHSQHRVLPAIKAFVKRYWARQQPFCCVIPVHSLQLIPSLLTAQDSGVIDFGHRAAAATL